MLIDNKVISKIEQLFIKDYTDVCNSGERMAKYARKKYPNGVELTRENINKFARNMKLDSNDIGILCHALLRFVGVNKADDYLKLDYWGDTKKSELINIFFEMAKGTKLLK